MTTFQMADTQRRGVRLRTSSRRCLHGGIVVVMRDVLLILYHYCIAHGI